MRRLRARVPRLPLAACLAMAATLGASVAPAAQGPRRGELRGMVLNAGTGRPARRLEVFVTGLRRDGGGRVQERTRTDARGRFTFEGLPAGPGRLYGLHVRYQGGLFVEAPIPLPAHSARKPARANVAVWPTTTDPSAIRLTSDRMFVLPAGGGRAGVLEFVSIANDGNEAYIGRARAMGSGGDDADPASPSPSVAFYLPPDGSDVSLEDSSFVIPQLVPSQFGFGITVAVPPGEHDLTFGYRLEGTGGTYELGRVALYPIAEYSVFVDESLSLESDRLQDRGFVTIRGGRYREWTSTEGFEAGDRIQASVTTEGGDDPVLIGGLVVFAVVVLGALAVALVRRRTHRGAATRREPGPAPEPERERERLVEAIAELDIRRDQGDVSEEEWASARADLKERLAALVERAS